VNWRYFTEPEPMLHERAVYWPRGRVLGGSSAINAMVWSRGFPSDYDRWNRVASGWDWSQVEPVFRSIERWSGAPSKFRGSDGPQAVYDTQHDVHPLCDRFLAAANDIGLPATDDYNGPEYEGVCRYQITTQGGMRASAARSYLHPAMQRPNLTVRTHAEVCSLNWRNGAIEGVSWREKGNLQHAQAENDVIVSAGAIASPALLQRAGIGDPDLLQSLGIVVKHANSHVGAHLQDHIGADAAFHASVPSLNEELLSWPARIRTASRYVLTRRGPLSLSGNHAGGFVRSQPSVSEPDLQLYFNPMSYTRAPPNTKLMVTPDAFPGFLIGFNPCRPTSRGYVRVRSVNPNDKPLIQANYLSTEEDRQLMLQGMRLVRQLAASKAISSATLKEMSPGSECDSDDAMLEHVKQTAWTVFHPSGTCRMGDDANTSVVDARLRVHGVSGLRVVDASVFPNVPSGNTNAPCIMVAERAAAMMLTDALSNA